jgi:hypothetical protein
VPSYSEFVLVPGNSETSAISPNKIPACPGTRLQHGIHKPKVYTDGKIRYSFFSASGEPQHYQEGFK